MHCPRDRSSHWDHARLSPTLLRLPAAPAPTPAGAGPVAARGVASGVDKAAILRVGHWRRADPEGWQLALVLWFLLALRCLVVFGAAHQEWPARNLDELWNPAIT